MFRDIIAGYSHWGWYVANFFGSPRKAELGDGGDIESDLHPCTPLLINGRYDTDIIFGDLSSALEPYLDTADTVTFLDGVLNALYLGGQLTVFRNNAYFRSCFSVG